jgi:hypothetical protein
MSLRSCVLLGTSDCNPGTGAQRPGSDSGSSGRESSRGTLGVAIMGKMMS